MRRYSMGLKAGLAPNASGLRCRLTSLEYLRTHAWNFEFDEPAPRQYIQRT